MSHRVTALYHDREKARLAAEDLRSTGFPVEAILLADGLAPGSGRLEITAKDMDQSIDVRTFLEGDGAHSVEIRGGEDAISAKTMPSVPAAN